MDAARLHNIMNTTACDREIDILACGPARQLDRVKGTLTIQDPAAA